MNSLFHKCRSVETIKFGNINTSLVKNMDKMFNYCESLESIDLINFDVSSVTKYAFNVCQLLFIENNKISRSI